MISDLLTNPENRGNEEHEGMKRIEKTEKKLFQAINKANLIVINDEESRMLVK